jgi:hypothetical protein
MLFGYKTGYFIEQFTLKYKKIDTLKNWRQAEQTILFVVIPGGA